MVFSAQLEHLQTHAARVAWRWMSEHQGQYSAVERFDDGLEIHGDISIDENGGVLCVRAPRHSGNLNAPFGVLRAALLYVMRSVVDEEIPLNEGILRPWKIKTTTHFVLSTLR